MHHQAHSSNHILRVSLQTRMLSLAFTTHAHNFRYSGARATRARTNPLLNVYVHPHGQLSHGPSLFIPAARVLIEFCTHTTMNPSPFHFQNAPFFARVKMSMRQLSATERIHALPSCSHLNRSCALNEFRYRTGDGRIIWLLGMESDRHWPGASPGLLPR